MAIEQSLKDFEKSVREALLKNPKVILMGEVREAVSPELSIDNTKNEGVFKVENGTYSYESPITFSYINPGSDLRAKDVQRGDILEIHHDIDSPIGMVPQGTQAVCLGSQPLPLIDTLSFYLLGREIYHTTCNTKLFVKTDETPMTENEIQALPWIREWLTDEDKNRLNSTMETMQEKWKKRWCSPGEMGCACMGAANCSGNLANMGFTKEHWKEWIKNHQEK